MGVDGFRFDAAKYIYFGEEARNVEFWDWYMGQLRAIKPDIYTVAEVWDADFATTPYFSSTNCFNFTMSQNNGQIARAAREGNVNSFVYYVSNYIQSIKEQNPDAMPITFIANHDMDRAAGFLPVENGLAKVAANLSMLMPGSSYIYYGEEIGLKGSRGGATTDANRRLAMLWGDNDTVKDPTSANYKGEQTNGTVASQLSQADSLYNHYKKLILLRKANPEIANGTYTPLKLLDSGKAGGFLSTYQGASVAVIHNTQLEAVTIDISKCSEITAMAIAAYVGVGSATLEGTMLTIEAQTSVVLR
jgi:glycosidase